MATHSVYGNVNVFNNLPIHQAQFAIDNASIITLPTIPIPIIPAPNPGLANIPLAALGLGGLTLYLNWVANYENVDPSIVLTVSANDGILVMGYSGVETLLEAGESGIFTVGLNDFGAGSTSSGAFYTASQIEFPTLLSFSNGALDNLEGGDPGNFIMGNAQFLTYDYVRGLFV